jgi:hypothetical protein
MSATRTSFWRDSRNIYVLYMVAGVAAVPAGLIYALLAAKNLDRWWTTCPLLALGLISALLVWSYCERHWFSAQKQPFLRAVFNVHRASPSKNSL